MINYVINDNDLTVFVKGKPTHIESTDKRYEAVLEAIKDNRLDEIPDLIDEVKQFKELEGCDYRDGAIYINDKRIPDVLTDKILDFRDKDVPFEPIVKFATKLMDNPSYNSRQQLYRFLESNNMPLTTEGNFMAYKKVRHNFMDCHTGTMDNSVGKYVTMDRSEVDDNPNNTCSKGLHVASWEYAKGFGSKHVEVEINPIDVVCVPEDYNGTKMRVCKFTVLNECKTMNESTEYAG